MADLFKNRYIEPEKVVERKSEMVEDTYLKVEHCPESDIIEDETKIYLSKWNTDSSDSRGPKTG